MRILQVIPYFYPAWSYGGPVRSVYELAKGLVKNGHEVTVFTTDAYDEHSRVEYKGDQTDIEGINVKYFKNLSNYIAWNYKIFFSPNMIKAIKNELRNFDIIHLHEYRTLQNIWIHKYARKYDIPYVISTRGVDPLYNTENRLITLKWVYDVLYGRKLLKKANRVIVFHKDEGSKIVEMGVNEQRIFYVPNGINLLSLNEIVLKKGRFRKQYKIGSEEKIILFLGRIDNIKGLDILIKSFIRLVNTIKNVRLVIVGSDGGFLNTLKRFIIESNIEQRVLFTGFLQGDEKVCAYIDADVYVLPSYYDAFPNTVLEAMSYGTPVIVSNHCGIVEWLNKDEACICSPNETELYNSFLNVLLNDKLRASLSEKGRQVTNDRFGWDKVVRKVEEVYLSLIEG